MKLVFLIMLLLIKSNANVNVVCKAGIMDNNSAKSYINKLLKKEPRNIECILKLANIHLKSGDLLKGYKLIERAYDTNPSVVEHSDMASVLSYALKMSKLAKEAKKSSNKLIWNEIGDNFFDMGIYAESIKAYKNSLDIDEKQSNIGLKLALSYNKINNVDEAVNQLFILVEQNEKDFYASYYLGKILRYSINDEDSAMRFFEASKNILITTKKNFTDIEYATYINDINMELGK